MLYNQQWADSKVTNILIAARKLIEDEVMWCQHEFVKGKRHCTLGAIMEIPADRRSQNKAVGMLLWAIRRKKGAGSQAIVFWNDADWRTHSEVVAAFDRAIAESRRTHHAAETRL